MGGGGDGGKVCVERVAEKCGAITPLDVKSGPSTLPVKAYLTSVGDWLHEYFRKCFVIQLGFLEARGVLLLAMEVARSTAEAAVLHSSNYPF